MTNQPHNSTIVSNTIQKVKNHWAELRENIRLENSASCYDKWLSQIPVFQRQSYHSDVCIFLWDIFSNRFLIAIDERNITGYDMEKYTEDNGVYFSLGNFHPEHINAIHLINHCISEWFMRHRDAADDTVIINLDALYRIKNGNYIHVLQQIVPVEKDASGNAFMFLSYGHDITHLKKQSSASCIFVAPGESRFCRYSFETKQLETIARFTLQETKVLHLLSDGKQTKYIAQKLSLSPHTVDTHRRNLLAKTSCVDSTALIAYCRMVGLL